MNEDQFIEYFENLATQSRDINHDQEKKKSFFYIEDAFTLDEFDEALRNAAQTPVMILVADDGSFTDNNSANYTQEVEGEILILARIQPKKNIRQIRAMCLPIVLSLLARMKLDSSKNKILPDPKKKVFFRIEDIPYRKIGPMNLEWYGYAFNFKFICPFGFSVTSGSWRDIDAVVVPVTIDGSLPSEIPMTLS